jgi:competence protein ComEA
MIAAAFVRLGMVTLTLTAVYLIGWSVSGSDTPEPLGAVDLRSAARSLEVLAAPAPPTVPDRSPEGREDKTMRRPEASLDLNRATEQDLERLPGIGPVLAGRIVDYRTAQGAFDNVEQLRRVKGIGKKKFEQIRPHVTVSGPHAAKPSRKTA